MNALKKQDLFMYGFSIFVFAVCALFCYMVMRSSRITGLRMWLVGLAYIVSLFGFFRSIVFFAKTVRR